jgi:hypothetical protein
LSAEDWTVADVTESMMKHQLLGGKNKKSATGETQPKGHYGGIFLDYEQRQT